MRIGIIVYSITGNTLSVGKQLLESFSRQGLDASLVEVKVKSDHPDESFVEFLEKPDVSQYDQLVFASPVHAFSLSRVMKTYLGEINTLAGKPCVLFVTHHFPKAWMGGNQALRQMQRRIEKNKGLVSQSFCINWSSKNRDQDIKHLLDKAFR